MPDLILVLLIPVGLYLMVNVLAALLCLRPPRVPLYLTPDQMGIPGRRIELDSDGVRLAATWTSPEGPVGVLVCLHGFVMNRAEWMPYVLQWHREGWACLFVDLRGQGSSGKAPVSFGDRERRDAAVAARWARSQAPDVPVVLVGSSMGAAAAVLAVADEPGLADGLILDGCYRNLHEASRGWWIMLAGPWLDALLRLTMPIGSLISGLRPRQVSVEDALPRLDGVPILMLNGDADPIVPWASAEANLRAAGDLAELHRFAGSGHGHGRFREPVRFRALVSDWLKNRFAPRDISDPRP